MRKLVVFCIVALGLNFGIVGQVNRPPAISQYMFNPLSSNPGYAGFYDMVIATNLFRSSMQTGANNYSNTFNVHSSLPIDNLGAGINIQYDKVGITTAANIDLSLSYKLAWGDNKLSFGAQGTYFNIKDNYSLLPYGYAENPNTSIHEDQFRPDGNTSITKPNFGLGVMYSGRKFFGGLSAPRLLQVTEELSNIYTVENNTVDTTRTSRFNPYYSFSLGTIISVKDMIEMKPSFMLKYVKETGMLLDLNYSILLKQTAWLGVSFRNAIQNPKDNGLRIFENLNSIALLGQLQLNDKFKAGVSYAIPLNKAKLNSGFHPFELMLNYNIAVFEEQGVHTFLY